MGQVVVVVVEVVNTIIKAKRYYKVVMLVNRGTDTCVIRIGSLGWGQDSSPVSWIKYESNAVNWKNKKINPILNVDRLKQRL